MGKGGMGMGGGVGLGSDGGYAAFPVVAAAGILMVSMEVGVSLVGVEGVGSSWSDSFWRFFLFFLASAVEAGPLVRLARASDVILATGRSGIVRWGVVGGERTWEQGDVGN